MARYPITTRLDDLFSSRTRVRVIQAIIAAGELNISTIVSRSRGNHVEVMKHVEYLKHVGIVDDVRLGRIHLVRVKDSALARVLQEFVAIFPDEDTRASRYTIKR
nr:helix-turn-helix transcriptional regulator [Candidatus Sigynarchaeota archaeon]